MTLDEFLQFLARCSLLVKRSVKYFDRWLTEVFFPRVSEGTPSLKLDVLKRLAANVKKDDEFGFLEEKIDDVGDRKGGPNQTGQSGARNSGNGVTMAGMDTNASLMQAWGVDVKART